PIPPGRTGEAPAGEAVGAACPPGPHRNTVRRIRVDRADHIASAAIPSRSPRVSPAARRTGRPARADGAPPPWRIEKGGRRPTRPPRAVPAAAGPAGTPRGPGSTRTG